MPRFASEAEEVLRAAGWFEGRNVATSRWVAQIQRDGYIPFEALTRFLSEFGGLRLVVRGRILIDLDGATFLSRTVPENVKDLSCAAGEELCPIGGDEPYTFLLMGLSGSVHLYNDAQLTRVAGSGELALESLILSRLANIWMPGEDVPLEPFV